MIKIYTILRTGQPLMPEVMQGVIANQCILIPITSRTDSTLRVDRKNMADNWLESFRVSEEDVFIGMDSDTIVAPGFINFLLADLQLCDVVAYHRPGNEGHDLFAFRKKLLLEYPYAFIDDVLCPTCAWIKKIAVNKIVLKKCCGIMHAKRI